MPKNQTPGEKKKYPGKADQKKLAKLAEAGMLKEDGTPDIEKYSRYMENLVSAHQAIFLKAPNKNVDKKVD